MSFSPSPEPPNESSSNLITPRVDNDQPRQLLSPPPAPSGWNYDERDVLTNLHGNAELRQAAECRLDRNVPILDFPLPCSASDDSPIRRQDADFLFTPRSPSLILPSRRRRANSIDAISQPRINLRPRFTIDRPLQRSALLLRQGSSPVDPNNEFKNLRLHSEDRANTDTTNQRPQNCDNNNLSHKRSHTDSSFFRQVFEIAPHASMKPTPNTRLFYKPVRTSHEQQLYHHQREQQRTPPISPPKSNFGYPASLAKDVTRPIPRYKHLDQKIYKSNSPLSEKRFSAANFSEVITTSTLSSSNNSAFGTPVKVTKSHSSPSTCTSDSKTLEEEVGNYDNFNSSQDIQRVLPSIPHCGHADQTPAKPQLLVPRHLKGAFHSRPPFPFDEVHLNDNDSKDNDKDSQL